MFWRTWGSRAILPLITIAGLAIRMITLGDRSLWSDEIFSLFAAHLKPQHIVFPRLIDNGNNVLFYLVAHFWVGLLPAMPPVNETLLHLLPLGFSVATIPVLYLLAKRTAHAVAPHRSAHIIGVIAAAFYALSPLAVTYAQEFRGYSLELLLLTMSYLALISALSGTSRAARWWTVYALLAGLSLYAHLLASLMIASQLLVVALLMLSKRAQQPRVTHLIAAGATFGALITPLLLTAVHAGGGPIDWVPHITYQSVEQTLLLLMGGDPGGDMPWPRMLCTLVVFGVVGFGLAHVLQKARLRQSSGLLLLSAALVPPLLGAGFSLLIHPIWIDRYLQFLLIPVAQLFAIGLMGLWHLNVGVSHVARAVQNVALRTAVPLLALLMVIASLQSTLARAPNEDWPALARAMQQSCPADQTKRFALTGAPKVLQQNVYFYQIPIDETEPATNLPRTNVGESLCLIAYHPNLSTAAFNRYIQQLAVQVGPMAMIPGIRGVELYYFQAAKP
jgi:uncharacterized membrane protein